MEVEKMRSKLLGIATAAGLSVFGWSQSLNAMVIDWVDWTGTGFNTVTGTLAGGTVDVTYSGSYAFAQTGTGTNYWTEPLPSALPYTGNPVVDNAPTPSEQIALAAQGTRTVTFSQAVLNPVFAFNSWNGDDLTFAGGVTTTVLSTGVGYWGVGLVADTGNGFISVFGEPHGVLQLIGSFTSFTFSNSRYEYWHGFTIGIEGLYAYDVPEPGTLTVFALGLAGLGYMRRRRAA
jgi:hypothetical protein